MALEANQTPELITTQRKEENKMTRYKINCLFDGESFVENCVVAVENGTIVSIQKDSMNYDHLLKGTVTPGFIDTQVNGGGGVLFNHDQSLSALSTITTAHQKFGTTSMMPTLITDSLVKMQKAAEAVSSAFSSQLAGIVGIHFEGPHLSVIKKGIHSEQQIRSISDRELALFTRNDIGKVMITVAPENVPCDIIKDLVKQDVIVSLGHSNADIDTVIKAMDAGATGFTHLFNAMSGLTARSPGMIAAALHDERMYSGLIADMHHVDPYNCKLAYKAIGTKKLMLVTDAMAHVGSSIATLPWLDTAIVRHKDKLTTLSGNLAGSCLDMAAAVKNMTQKIGITLPDALIMASKTPAEFLKLNNLGSIAVGQKADFILFNDNLSVEGCWINGTQMFKTETV